MNQERLLNIILTPYLSEKATIGIEKKNQYVFKIAEFASKADVKDAVEHLFNAKVKDVTVMNVRSKKKSFRGKEGSRKGWKKAYVTLQSEQKLDFIGA